MPNKTIYVKDVTLWAEAQDKAAALGKSMSEVIEESLTRFVNEMLPPEVVRAVNVLVAHGFPREQAVQLIIQARKDKGL